METIMRKPFQGTINIVRFNWHFYVLALGGVTALMLMLPILPDDVQLVVVTIVVLILLTTTLSLAASFYVYDYSGLYAMDWLNSVEIDSGSSLVNINAGFDETSSILTSRYPDSKLTVYDFYNPARHTEVSIERARKAYPAFPDTQTISTSAIPLALNSIDFIFNILAAHEIRDPNERIGFFTKLHDCIRSEGRIIVVEHLRDIPNLLVYNIGFFHFFSRKNWKLIFDSANLTIDKEIKITPFVSAFILKKNGITS